MVCNRLTDEQICELTNVLMSRWKAWAALRHISSCQECATRYDSMRKVATAMQTLQESDLESRRWGSIEDQLNSPETELRPLRTRASVLTRITGIACVAAILIVGAAVGSELLFAPSRAVFRDNNGHVWNLQMAFSGKALIYAPDGHLVGTFGNESVVPALLDLAAYKSNRDACLFVDTDGEHFTLQGLGRHPLTDREGNSLGSIALLSFNKGEIAGIEHQITAGRMPGDFTKAAAWARQQDESDGGCGASGNVDTAYGYNEPAQFYWFTRGIVSARMTSSDGFGASADAGIASSETQDKILGYHLDVKLHTPPRISITNGSHTFILSGYGTWTYFSPDHKISTTLTVAPLGQLKKPELIMINNPARVHN